ncbi:adhesion G protein-coupled receptor L3-like [Hydractinia symbiolongicarpus]|uniref:adhesion G protein-coupled receptor L3-like n=1 Tax=Hydractinia symbiolongicarpus TaxID=13093 RepID=UPI00254D5562|nr:adhesion G protein-coupled receptor L3-like [Hydractinia symbiolongicarpus]
MVLVLIMQDHVLLLILISLASCENLNIDTPYHDVSTYNSDSIREGRFPTNERQNGKSVRDCHNDRPQSGRLLLSSFNKLKPKLLKVKAIFKKINSARNIKKKLSDATFAPTTTCMSIMKQRSTYHLPFTRIILPSVDKQISTGNKIIKETNENKFSDPLLVILRRTIIKSKKLMLQATSKTVVIHGGIKSIKTQLVTKQPQSTKYKPTKKSTTMTNKENCQRIGRNKRPPRSCYEGVFASLYNQLYDDVKRPRVFSQAHMKSVVKVVKEENLTDTQLIMITDLINVEAKTPKYQDVLDLCNEVIDDKNIEEMKVLNELIPVGIRLLNDIEVIISSGLDDVDRSSSVEKYLKNIVYQGVKMSPNNTMTFSDELANDDQDQISIRNHSAKGNIIFSTVVIKNINKLLPVNVKNKSVGSNNSFINSNIISGTLYTANSKKEITKDIVSVITLRHLKTDVEYKQIPVFWQILNSTSGTWSTSGCKVLTSSANATTFTCNHLTNFAILVTGELTSAEDDIILSYITTIGLIISIFCELVSIAVMIYIRQLTTRRKLILNLLVNMLLAHILFVSLVEKAKVTVALCAIVALGTSFWYTCSFMWMLNIGIHLVFSVTTRLMSKRRRLLYFYCVGYGIPVALQIIGLSYTKGKGFGTKHHCWLSDEALWIFVIPVATVVATNFGISMYVLRRLYGTKVMENAKNIIKAKKLLRALVVLTPSLGLTWLVGIFVSIFPKNRPLQYVFALFSTNQGVWIFICCMIMDKKIRTDLHRRFTPRNRSSQRT